MGARIAIGLVGLAIGFGCGWIVKDVTTDEPAQQAVKRPCLGAKQEMQAFIDANAGREPDCIPPR